MHTTSGQKTNGQIAWIGPSICRLTDSFVHVICFTEMKSIATRDRHVAPKVSIPESVIAIQQSYGGQKENNGGEMKGSTLEVLHIQAVPQQITIV
jgi:hypothetical protein